MNDLTLERAARRDTRARKANEQLEAAAREYGIDFPVPFICECDEPSCHTVVRMSLADYREVRADARHFINVPGHEGEAVVVVRRNGYVIVEKGSAGRPLGE